MFFEHLTRTRQFVLSKCADISIQIKRSATLWIFDA
jgi:hypothetical protein